MASTFLGDHEDFVLKLKIKADDGSTQIRRLRLPRVGDGNGSVSYHELVGLVVTFTFPEGSPENFHVSLNYLDVDQDTITISSSEELVDAIEQFSGKKVLRIDTEVKPKTTSGGTPKTSPRETSTASTSTPAVQHTTTPRASQTDGGTSPPSQDLPIATILNSFVGVLATAVVALQEGLSAPAGASAKKASKAAHAAVDKASIAVGKASDAVSAAASKASTTASKASAAAASAAASATEDASKATDNSASMPDLKPASKDQAAGSQESTETEEEEEEPRPFIHGRHTCDSCLTTPIVGKRCHAKNLPDYDLCQNCFENYNGTEIAFEFVELDRDRAFQDRWQHRRNVILRKSGEESGACRPGRKFGMGGRGRLCGPRGHRFGPGGHRGHPGPHCPPPGHDHHGPPPCPPPPHVHPHGPPPHHGPPPPFGPPPHHGPHCHPPFGPPHHHHHGPPPHWAHMGPHVGPHVQSHLPSGFGSFDDALNEAVRRSLQDVAPKEEAIIAETQVVDAEETAEEEFDASPLEEFKDAPEEEEIVVEAESLVQKPAPVPSAPVEDEPASVSTHSSLKSFPNVDPVFDDEDDEAAEEPAVIESDPTIAFKQSEADDSFASDAVGNGDIAEAMGATLDMVAGVISDMLSEADAHNKPASKKEAPRVSETSGAMILEPTDGTKQDDEDSDGDTDNEWHVVGSDDESLKQDEEIARAAEMLGSALFNSDMRSPEEVIPNSDTRSSGEAVSNLSHSEGSYAESFSVASVPSTVPSIAHSWQVGASHRDRWSIQLSQLRELGFDDESLCVEIIERLNAANIGCDADEEVSVAQVVNALLKNN